MTGLGILLLIVLFFWLFWPSISRWLKNLAIRKAENYIRKKMGMPPPPKDSRRNDREYTQRKKTYSKSPIIPKEYAEDVEFIETKNFSQQETSFNQNSSKEKYHESQISDAEWTEIKSDRSK